MRLKLWTLPDLLQFQEPLAQLFGREVHAVTLVADVVVLAVRAAEVAHAGKVRQGALASPYKVLHTHARLKGTGGLDYLKKTLPLPRCPWQHGSSPNWGAANQDTCPSSRSG